MRADRVVYRRLLVLLPTDFRRRYGGEMEESFAEILGLEVARRGCWGRIHVWGATLVDLVHRASVERLRERARRDRRHPRTPDREAEPMATFLAELRYALRALARRPAFTVTAVVTLALGIGANTTIFSVVDTLLFRPLPYPDADRLVAIWSQNPERGWSRTDVALPDAWDWKSRTTVFEDLAVYDRGTFNLTGVERPERLLGSRTTTNLFSLFGIEPRLGRAFLPEDGRPGAEPVAVLSHAFFERRFGSARSVLGSTLELDGEPHTVVGVMGPDFVPPDTTPDVWLAYRTHPRDGRRGSHSQVAVGRLRPGVSIAEADRAVAQVALALEQEYPETNRGWTTTVRSLHADRLGPIARQASLVLLGAVGFVLLIACVNVANLLLAHGGTRGRELAVRTALGAGRGRVLRQLLLESLLLSLGGGALGLALAAPSLHWLKSSLPPQVPPIFFSFGIDRTVLSFTLVAAVGTTLLFGLVPALRISRPSLEGLREAGRAEGQSRGGGRLRGTLVVAEVALAVVLLVGGGLLMRSVVHLQQQDLGLEPEQLLTLQLSLPDARYPEDEDLRAFFDEALERIRARPEVDEAATVQPLPLGGSNWVGSFVPVGAADADTGREIPARFSYVSDRYFETAGIALRAGRTFGRQDHADSERVVVVNETLVERAFGGSSSPIGRLVLVSGLEQPSRIVGVVEDVLERGVSRPAEAAIYTPASQDPVRSAAFMVRSSLDPSLVAAAVREEVHALDPDQPLHSILSMSQVVDRQVSSFSLIATLMGTFALVSLALGAIGLYGVTAYGVVQRRNEIGIRMALGARRRDVQLMVIREGVGRTVLGLGIGLALALLLSRALTGLVSGVSASDPLTFASVAGVLLVVALLGSYLPARKASHLDPSRALRVD